MNYQEFVAEIKANIPVGTAIPNPGGGFSTIVSYTEKNTVYQRKNSPISVAFEDLYKVYEKFKGKKVYTTDLKGFSPKVFDSTRRGHSCNTTFLFSVLQILGRVTEIKGEGKTNHPFYVSIIPE